MQSANGVDLVEQTRSGHGLPAAAYTDPEFLRREQQSLFAGSWMCIGSVSDVPAPGDVKPLVFAGHSLLLARAQDDRVRVFFNYCRHRGLRLVREPCQRQRLVCPYHAWMYGLDGALLRTPHIAGADDHDGQKAGVDLPDGLEAVRTAIWHQMIFVNVSGTAPPFEEVIAPLDARWAEYDFSGLAEAETAVYDVGCNWKLAIENFIDVYHIPYVHPGLEAYSSFRDHSMVHEGLLTGQWNDDVDPPDYAVGKLPEFPGLPEGKRRTLEALSLFPNLLMAITVDYLRFIIIEPTGPNSCREHLKIFVIGEETARDPALAEARRQLRLRFEAFNNEDIDIAQELQASMMGSGFRRAHLSPAFDRAVQTFQTRVAEALRQ